MRYEGQIVDLSTPVEATVSLEKDLPVYAGLICRAYDVRIRSHTGSYFETPSHLFRDTFDPFRFRGGRLFFRCLVRRVVPEGREISASILDRTCRVRNHDALLVIPRWNRKKREEFPYFSKDAGQWIGETGLKVFGADTPRYDSGFEHPTGFFLDLFRKGVSIVANLSGMHRLPDGDCTLIVMPLLVRNVCTVPARILAVVPGHSRGASGRKAAGRKPSIQGGKP